MRANTSCTTSSAASRSPRAKAASRTSSARYERYHVSISPTSVERTAVIIDGCDPRGRDSVDATADLVVAAATEEVVELLGRHEHVACLRAGGRADHPALLEQVHHPSGAGEADAELALEHRCRAELRADDELHRLPHEGVVVIVVAAAAEAATHAGHVVVVVAHDLLVDDLGVLPAPVR